MYPSKRLKGSKTEREQTHLNIYQLLRCVYKQHFFPFALGNIFRSQNRIGWMYANENHVYLNIYLVNRLRLLLPLKPHIEKVERKEGWASTFGVFLEVVKHYMFAPYFDWYSDKHTRVTLHQYEMELLFNITSLRRFHVPTTAIRHTFSPASDSLQKFHIYIHNLVWFFNLHSRTRTYARSLSLARSLS